MRKITYALQAQQKKFTLPTPTVQYTTDPNQPSAEVLRGALSNPIYTGVPPFPQVVSDEVWIEAAAELIKEDGAEQFLVNMLYMLRASMAEVMPSTATLENNNRRASQETGLDDEEVGTEQATLFCTHDGLPIIPMGEVMTCAGMYLLDHLRESPVTDLLTEPFLTIVFRNGHTLPLLCPLCGDSLHWDDTDDLLNQLNGKWVIKVEWLEEPEEGDGTEGGALVLVFSSFEGDKEPLALPIKLTSIYELTCPQDQIWHSQE